MYFIVCTMMHYGYLPSKMEGSLGVNRVLALLAAAPGRAMVADEATIYDHLVVVVSPILISLDDFSSPGRAVKAGRQSGQVDKSP